MPGEIASIHATAVAIAGRALLIQGPSRAGKSRLACALIAASTRRRPIRLIGDDRILLFETAFGLVARPHPRITGFIERRGLGIVALPHVEGALIAAAVLLGPGSGGPIACGENFPVLRLVDEGEADARRNAVLDWWNRVESATSAPHS